jgi:hypothetical protein
MEDFLVGKNSGKKFFYNFLEEATKKNFLALLAI